MRALKNFIGRSWLLLPVSLSLQACSAFPQLIRHSDALTPEGRHILVTHPRGPTLVFRLASKGTVFKVPPKA